VRDDGGGRIYKSISTSRRTPFEILVNDKSILAVSVPGVSYHMLSKGTLLVQCAIVVFCGVALTQFAVNFPFPSPLVKPLLPPKVRWPTEQVQDWIESGKIDGGFLDFFNRDPERIVPSGKNPVSPADGVLVSAGFHDGASEFVVGLSFWDVHVVRTPVAGVVKSIEQDGSIFLRTFAEYQRRRQSGLEQDVALRGKTAPVQAIVTLSTVQGDVKVRLITSYWASRLRIWVHDGQRLEKGERVGRILLGSTVVAEFPGEVEFSVQPSQRVVAGETIISKDNAFQ